MLRESQIARQRFQYMLPRAALPRADANIRADWRQTRAGSPGPGDLWPNHLRRSHCRHGPSLRSGMSFLPLEEARAEARGHDLRCGLAGTVRIMAAQRVDLTIGILPFAIFIHLVGRDQHDGADRLRRPRRSPARARGPHDVGGQRAEDRDSSPAPGIALRGGIRLPVVPRRATI